MDEAIKYALAVAALSGVTIAEAMVTIIMWRDDTILMAVLLGCTAVTAIITILSAIGYVYWYVEERIMRNHKLVKVNCRIHGEEYQLIEQIRDKVVRDLNKNYLMWVGKYGCDVAGVMRSFAKYFFYSAKIYAGAKKLEKSYKGFWELFELGMRAVSLLPHKQRNEHLAKLAEDLINGDLDSFVKHSVAAWIEANIL
jgi:hypothetical protein